jgi:hypothetical protein
MSDYTICINSWMIDAVIAIVCSGKLVSILWGWLGDYLDMKDFKRQCKEADHER